MNILNDLLDGFTEESKKVKYVRGPMKWPGSKLKVLDRLLPALPTKDRFVDACGGSGIVTLNVQAKIKIFNDRHTGVTALYRCLRNPVLYGKLMDKVEYSINSLEEFEFCKAGWEACEDTVERAFRWLYLANCSFSGNCKIWGRNTETMQSTSNSLRKKGKHLERIHAACKDLVVENMDCLKLARLYDNSDTLTYFDPPYRGTNQGLYGNVMPTQYYRWIPEFCMEAVGATAISHYQDSEIDSYDWDERHEFPVNVNMSANHKRKTDVECLWIKY